MLVDALNVGQRHAFATVQLSEFVTVTATQVAALADLHDKFDRTDGVGAFHRGGQHFHDELQIFVKLHGGRARSRSTSGRISDFGRGELTQLGPGIVMRKGGAFGKEMNIERASSTLFQTGDRRNLLQKSRPITYSTIASGRPWKSASVLVSPRVATISATSIEYPHSRAMCSTTSGDWMTKA